MLALLICNTSCLAGEGSAGRTTPALFAVTPCFPLHWAGGQASTTGSFGSGWSALLHWAPSPMPGLLKQREREGKAWERKGGGRGKELMLEISRKEAKSLNALLAEILCKMGRSRAKLRDFIS